MLEIANLSHTYANGTVALDDVGGQDHGHLFADLGQQVEKAVALLRVEAGGGFVDDD
jgi:hypothetical protein